MVISDIELQLIVAMNRANQRDRFGPVKVLTPATETGEVNWSGADLEAFLEALTGQIPQNVGPLD